jgi:hypothetical protein
MKAYSALENLCFPGFPSHRFLHGNFSVARIGEAHVSWQPVPHRILQGQPRFYMSADPDGLFQPYQPPLNQPDRATFYGGNTKDYTDHPSLSEAA